MRLSLNSVHTLFRFKKTDYISHSIAEPAADRPGPQLRVLAHRFSLLLAAWIGIYILTDLLLHLTWPGLLTVVAYLSLGLAMIARYPLWTHSWFVKSTPLSVHLAWLGVGLLLALIGSLLFPGYLLGFLAILAVEGHVVLSFTNRYRGRLWFIGVAVLAAYLYMSSMAGPDGLLAALPAAPLALAALIGLDLLVDAFLPIVTSTNDPPPTREAREISPQRYRNYVNRIETLAIAKERARIGREFHDTLGHTLTTLDVQMELMARLPANRIGEIQEAARQSRRLVKEGLADVRRSIRALHPNALEGFSVVEAIQSLVDEFNRTSQVEIQWQIEGKVAQLAPDLALPLHRAVQVALTNVRRHSGATEVKVTLGFSSQTVWLLVEDNGCIQTLPKFGFGLSGVRDRVQELHGEFEAGPRADRGFRLVVRLPRYLNQP